MLTDENVFTNIQEKPPTPKKEIPPPGFNIHIKGQKPVSELEAWLTAQKANNLDYYYNSQALDQPRQRVIRDFKGQIPSHLNYEHPNVRMAPQHLVNKPVNFNQRDLSQLNNFSQPTIQQSKKPIIPLANSEVFQQRQRSRELKQRLIIAQYIKLSPESGGMFGKDGRNLLAYNLIKAPLPQKVYPQVERPQVIKVDKSNANVLQLQKCIDDLENELIEDLQRQKYLNNDVKRYNKKY